MIILSGPRMTCKNMWKIVEMLCNKVRSNWLNPNTELALKRKNSCHLCFSDSADKIMILCNFIPKFSVVCPLEMIEFTVQA